MALVSVRSNKMRSLLTMLGIIIGIAAVIAIVTVGNSMTGTVTDSMSGMGVSNITLSLSQKSSEDTSGTAQGVTLRRFMDSTPGADDLITDEMLDEFTAAFPNEVSRIDLSQEVGSGTIEKYGDPETTITATVSGSNAAALQAMEDDTPILAGRWLDDEKGRRAAGGRGVGKVRGTGHRRQQPGGRRQVFHAEHQRLSVHLLHQRRL